MNEQTIVPEGRLRFFDGKHLEAARDFAKRTNQADKLQDQFDSLERIAVNCKALCWISTDFVPHSFYFQFYPDRFVDGIPNDWQRERIMNGGVIYHGKLEDSTQPETFAVTLTEESSWSIHT